MSAAAAARQSASQPHPNYTNAGDQRCREQNALIEHGTPTNNEAPEMDKMEDILLNN